MGQMNMGECPFAFVPKFPGAVDFVEDIRAKGPPLGRCEQRHGARLIIERKSRRVASIRRHFGEDRPDAEHQPFAGNLHAQKKAVSPRPVFLQKLLPRLP